MSSKESKNPNLSSSEVLVCTADLLDGVSIDLLSYCEMGDLSDEEQDQLWSETTEIQLLESCDECMLIETGDFDDAPGQSTVFYDVITENEAALKEQLRNRINEIISS